MNTFKELKRHVASREFTASLARKGLNVRKQKTLADLFGRLTGRRSFYICNKETPLVEVHLHGGRLSAIPLQGGNEAHNYAEKIAIRLSTKFGEVRVPPARVKTKRKP